MHVRFARSMNGPKPRCQASLQSLRHENRKQRNTLYAITIISNTERVRSADVCVG